MIAFTILDLKTELYDPPFYARARGEILRDFKDGANNKDTRVGKHPEDYVLLEIGKFDQSTGVLTMQEHITLGTAIDYVEKTKLTSL